MRVSYGEMSAALRWVSIPASHTAHQPVPISFTHRKPPNPAKILPRSCKKTPQKNPRMPPKNPAKRTLPKPVRPPQHKGRPDTPHLTPPPCAERLRDTERYAIFSSRPLPPRGSVGFLFVLCLFSVSVVPFSRLYPLA